MRINQLSVDSPSSLLSFGRSTGGVGGEVDARGDGGAGGEAGARGEGGAGGDEGARGEAGAGGDEGSSGVSDARGEVDAGGDEGGDVGGEAGAGSAEGAGDACGMCSEMLALTMLAMRSGVMPLMALSRLPASSAAALRSCSLPNCSSCMERTPSATSSCSPLASAVAK